MVGAITVLLVFQLIGEITVRSLGLPLPGPVVGMLLLFIALRVRGSVPNSLQVTSAEILQHLSLLFVPAGVGVMVQFALIRQSWLPLLAIVGGSTLLTMAATAWTLQLLAPRPPAFGMNAAGRSDGNDTL